MRRKALSLMALAGGALVLAGCGIRTTQVPVDAGPAPSRVPCEMRGEAPAQKEAQGFPVRVYLVCASRLTSVDRTARTPAASSRDSRIEVARTLLDELQRTPPTAEREAGFATDVPEPTTVAGRRAGDPEGALRLSRQPEDLPAAALAQIVCTLAESRAATAEGRVVLGGPAEYPAREYACTGSAKERPAEPLPAVGPAAAAEVRPAG